ncbi:uncharacterized protein LOC112575428 [Pomacea canaliculata]|uniref:uncharacterized protein LOC112575428 n=1 Tax=Pomacea canaliculata TaxID=400727 RepID=UPI000D725EC7|nr:uncharacterized protein LOC112575428 [Pomacea canaliculata]
MAIERLRCGHHVYIVSSCSESRAACSMLYDLLQQTVNTLPSEGVSPGQPHLLQYDLGDDKDVDKAVNDLSQAASGGSLYVIADEVGPDMNGDCFQEMCEKLLTQVPRLHIWAANCFHGYPPDGWKEENLIRPLRFTPAILRELKKGLCLVNYDDILQYSERGVPDHTDGPPVRQLYHKPQSHSNLKLFDCVTCGREVASFLLNLHVGVAENSNPPSLQWRDMLVLYWCNFSDNSGMVKGLQEAGIPVQLMTDDDFEDMVNARRDVVWVVYGDRVHGLERKVVVCLDDYETTDEGEDGNVFNLTLQRSDTRLYFMSRCTSQLVIVSNDGLPMSSAQ